MDHDESLTRAVEAVHRFIESFNAQDHEEHASTLNYPHIRLANGRFTRFESRPEFRVHSARAEEFLQREGWHHTSVRKLDVIHIGRDKAHLAIINDRCREDGTVYKSFETFWIATCIDNKWGIQFRSSYLT